jgi:hypothetical protein
MAYDTTSSLAAAVLALSWPRGSAAPTNLTVIASPNGQRKCCGQKREYHHEEL